MKDYRLSEMKKICEEVQKGEKYVNPLKCFCCEIYKEKVCEMVYGYPRNWDIDEKDGDKE